MPLQVWSSPPPDQAGSIQGRPRDERSAGRMSSVAIPVWQIRGTVTQACSCNYGCPCNFNAPPNLVFQQRHLNKRFHLTPLRYASG